MTKWIRSLSLAAALAATAGGTVVVATAQNKGEKKAEPAGAGSVEVYKGKSGYRYRVKNAAGKVIAMPTLQTSWETKEEAMRAVDELKSVLAKARPAEVKE